MTSETPTTIPHSLHPQMDRSGISIEKQGFGMNGDRMMGVLESYPWLTLALDRDQQLMNIQGQKNLQLQIGQQGRVPALWTNRPVYTSMISPKYAETSRTDKFIPFQFRDKRNHPPRPSNFSFIHPPPKQYHPTDTVSNASHTSHGQKPDYRKCARKATTLRELDVTPDTPKLRQTNSTKCQSPKGGWGVRKVEEFKRIRLLGRGKFGDVYLVKHRRSGFVAALKVICKADLLCGSEEENAKSLAQLARQVKVQAFLDHPNLIRLYDFFADQENFYLLLELACDGPLFELLETQHSFTEETTSMLVREVAAGVEYMHRHEVIHRDLKLENIVLSHGMAKICDFGWSVHCPREFRTTLCGTPLYLSPQILSGKHYNKKIDTWAIGALTHELFTGENPFNIKHKDDLSKIITEDFQMESGSPELRSFVTFILRKNPTKRPDADTILRHPFIEKYRDLETSEELCNLVQRKQRRKAMGLGTGGM